MKPGQKMASPANKYLTFDDCFRRSNILIQAQVIKVPPSVRSATDFVHPISISTS